MPHQLIGVLCAIGACVLLALARALLALARALPALARALLALA